MKNLFLITTILVLGCSQLFFTNKANAFQVQGKVVDIQNNEPLSFCSIALTDKKTGKQIGVDASLNGTFALPDINSGEYTLSLIYLGYKTVNIDLDFSAKNNALDLGTIKMRAENLVIAKAEKPKSKTTTTQSTSFTTAMITIH